MAALMRILRDRDLFERRVMLPVFVAGIVAIPLLIHWRVI